VHESFEGNEYLAVESTEGVSQIILGREFSRWAPSPFGVTVSLTLRVRSLPGL